MMSYQYFPRYYSPGYYSSPICGLNMQNYHTYWRGRDTWQKLLKLY